MTSAAGTKRQIGGDDMALPVIGVVGAGGTISSIAGDPINYIDYAETGRRLSVDEMIAAMPQLNLFAELVPLASQPVSSSAIGPKEWLELRNTIMDAFDARPDFAGVVILHGTGTMEETAFFLSLTLPADRPVVLVGAQRPLNAISSDALANAVNAVRVAGDVNARGRGVMIVMNDEIHAAGTVTKGSTMRVQAFHSGAFGPLGTTDPDRVIFRMSTTPACADRLAFDVTGLPELPRVDICYAFAGSDGTAARAFQAAGTQGIVSAGFAPGLQTPAERAALMDASQAGVAVVQSSRVGQGRVATRTWMRENGWVSAGELNPQKARILLMLGLLSTNDPVTLQELFDKF